MTLPGGGTGASFVTFEGIEGCGKSTQVERFAERLRRSGLEVVVTREPGGTALGRRLRSLLLAPHDPPVTPVAELMLYAADRAQHLVEVVDPALERGAVVVCDRFLDATLAYQGYGRGLGRDVVLDLHRHAPLDRRPDRTVVLDLAPEIALGRARSRNAAEGVADSEGRFEAEDLSFHRRVREGYLSLAGDDPRYVVIDAEGDAETVADRVWAAVGPGPDREAAR